MAIILASYPVAPGLNLGSGLFNLPIYGALPGPYQPMVKQVLENVTKILLCLHFDSETSEELLYPNPTRGQYLKNRTNRWLWITSKGTRIALYNVVVTS